MLPQLSVDRSMVFLIRRVQYGKGWETLENKAFRWLSVVQNASILQNIGARLEQIRTKAVAEKCESVLKSYLDCVEFHKNHP